MRDDLTQITVVLDRSGSMESVRQATIDGFNEFVNGQKQGVGEANITLVQFDSGNPYEVVFDSKSVKDCPKLTYETFVPRGNTPLLDAIGRTITDLGSKFSKMPEADRPGKVVIVILTDGYENASREYNTYKIAEMVKHQRYNYKWEFIFIGATQDAILTAQSFNIGANHSIIYSASCFDPAATKNVFTSTSANIGGMRSGQGLASYSNIQRQAAQDGSIAVDDEDKQ